jgi:hypothetical protein
MDFRPGDTVVRMRPVRAPTNPREHHGLREFGCYEVAQVAQGDLIRLVGLAGWFGMAGFDLCPDDPCA